jgi:ribosomal protein S18 acetylase RimI-like enzyme
MDNLVIRKITAREIEQFYSLFASLVKTEFPEYSEKTRFHMLTASHLWTKESYKQALLSDRKNLLGAFIGNQLTGIVDSTLYGGGVAFCNWLMIDTKFQKKGVGKTLLQSFEKLAMDAGCHCVFLYASKHNIAFYEKMGYKQSGVFEKGWFGNTDYLFTKILQEPKEENYLR